MSFFDWLGTAQGVELTHAVIVLLVAVAGYLSYLAKQQSNANATLLNNHLDEHVKAALLDRFGHAATPAEPPPGLPPAP